MRSTAHRTTAPLKTSAAFLWSASTSSPTYHRGQIRLDVGRIFANLPTLSGSGPIHNFARAPRSRKFPGRAWARSLPQRPFVDRDLQNGLRCPGSTGAAPLIFGANLGRGAGRGRRAKLILENAAPPPPSYLADVLSRCSPDLAVPCASRHLAPGDQVRQGGRGRRPI